MAKTIMIQGTMSGVGKSLIAAGLCRVFMQDGHRTAPFKSQNMALNSFITKDGLEMGRAQVMQAEAAGIEPEASMNPILLKPTNDVGSQVIVNGEVLGNMGAKEYFAYKKNLIPDIKKAFTSLEENYEIIVIEGAGSPAEINLRENDIVNMGLAEIIDSPVLLVADIDRGGVFAQLLGTVELLSKEERDRVMGLIINKFRGDKTILDPGIKMLEERCGIPVTGTLPYLNVSFDDEDSLSDRLKYNGRPDKDCIDIAVIRYPRISNFTDFNVFEYIDGVNVRYVSEVSKLGNPDIIFLPGSKNTMADLKWMRECGLEAAVISASGRIPVFGICGGYQMLGEEISDPENVEQGGVIRGMSLLSHSTVLLKDKTRKQVNGKTDFPAGFFVSLKDRSFSGYEIHMGRDINGDDCSVITGNGDLVYGSYVHGLFDDGNIAEDIVRLLAEKKGISTNIEAFDYAALKERNYDLLADMIRSNLDMDKVYQMLRESAI